MRGGPNHHYHSLELGYMLNDHADLHLQRLQQVRVLVFPYELLRFRAREGDVALLQKDCDVPSSDLPLGVHLVLQLPQSLGG